MPPMLMSLLTLWALTLSFSRLSASHANRGLNQLAGIMDEAELELNALIAQAGMNPYDLQSLNSNDTDSVFFSFPSSSSSSDSDSCAFNESYDW